MGVLAVSERSGKQEVALMESQDVLIRLTKRRSFFVSTKQEAAIRTITDQDKLHQALDTVVTAETLEGRAFGGICTRNER